jgi:polysaccharide export outer membrane protein
MVRQDGTFDMKLLGAIKVGERTADQVAQDIRAALARDYLVDPRVSVGIVEYARHKVNVMGEVHSPGVYLCPAHGPMLLSDALALAGGLLPTADAAHVSIHRLVADKPVALEADETASPDFQLQPDDAVDVPLLPRRHFTVLGQVERPGTYDFTQGHKLYLTDALALAGGFTRLANPSHVLLKRTQDGKETVEALNAKAMANSPKTQRLEIQNEDTITVPESLF